MGWNGSGAGKAVEPPKTKKVGGGISSAVMKGALGGLIVIVAALAVFTFFRGEKETPKAKQDKKVAAIKEVTPAPAPKAVEKSQEEARLDAAVAALREKYGAEIPKDWNKPYHPKAYRPDGSLKRYSRYVKVVEIKPNPENLPIEEQTFVNIAEQDIARALLVTPGEALVGDYVYGENFKERFLESLKEPIVIDKEKDTPAQQDLKEIVKETKDELKKRYDAGEDIVAIMNESRAQLKELGLYREEIKKMVADVKREHGDDLTEQDEKDLITAANKMLEDRGCKPLVLPESFIKQAEAL